MEHWDKLWKKDDYYAYHDIPLDTDGISHLLLSALSDVPPKQSLLEVGAGPATRTIPIAKEKNLDLTLVDLLESAKNLALKRSDRYGVKCDYLIGNALDLPIPDETYDNVCSIGLNEHFFGEKRYKCFSEMSRITKPGGKTIVIVPNKFGSIRIEQIIKELSGNWVLALPTFLAMES